MTRTAPTRPGSRLRAVGLRLTPRGAGFLVTSLVLLVAAPLASLPALLSVSAMLLGLVVLAAASVLLGRARLAVDRSFAPDVLTPGDAAVATVHVTNLSSVPALEVRWSDTVPSGVSADATGVLPTLGGRHGRRSRVRFTYPLEGLRRGRHRIGPLRVEVGDPFGLVQRRHAFGEPQDLVVLPRRHDLGAVSGRGVDQGVTAQGAAHQAGLGEDDLVARGYLPGDALKRMHWKATAHRGELMVRQEEQQDDPRVGVVVDVDAASFGSTRTRDGWSHSPELEWAVSAAASVVDHLSRAGFAVVLRAPGDAVDRRVDHADALGEALVDLAVLEPADDLDPSGTDPGERTVVAVLGRPDVAHAQAWVESLGGAGTVLALVAAGTRPAALDVLERAGWRCVAYTAHDDVAELWERLGVGRVRAAS